MSVKKGKSLKRCSVLFLAAALLVCLSSCGKSKEVLAVEESISSLGNIDINSEDKIEKAEEAYNALSDKDKGTVENYTALTEARDTFDELQRQHEIDKKAADSVINYIDRIGTVNGRSLSDIKRAKDAYDALTESQKALVSNYSALTDADQKYTELLVKPVEELIEKIGAYNPNSDTMPDGFTDALDAAEDAYEELDDDYKEKVSNKNALEDALAFRTDCNVKSLIEYIDENFNEIDYDTNLKVALAIVRYKLIPESDRDRVTNYSKVEEASEAFKEFAKKPPIQLNSYRLGKDIIGDPELFLNAENITDKIVKEFSIQVFAFDGDGVPVQTNFSDYATGCRYSNAVKPGERTKTNTYWTLYGTYNEMKQLVVIIKSVEFFDGSVWSNPDYDELYSRYNQKLLEAGDPNILKRT